MLRRRLRRYAPLLPAAMVIGAMAAILTAPPGTSPPAPQQPTSPAHPGAPATPRGETPVERRTRLLGRNLSDAPRIGPPSRAPVVSRRLIPQYRDGGRVRVFRARPPGWQPVAIVMHATGSGEPGSEFPSLERLGRFFARSVVASAHYGVDRQGRIVQFVRDDQAAFHVARPGWNDISIGIELINDNTGRQRFTRAQMQSTRRLVRHLGSQYGIPVAAVVRHRDIQPEDRRDPPDNFPWQRFIDSLR